MKNSSVVLDRQEVNESKQRIIEGGSPNERILVRVGTDIVDVSGLIDLIKGGFLDRETGVLLDDAIFAYIDYMIKDSLIGEERMEDIYNLKRLRDEIFDLKKIN